MAEVEDTGQLEDSIAVSRPRRINLEFNEDKGNMEEIVQGECFQTITKWKTTKKDSTVEIELEQEKIVLEREEIKMEIEKMALKRKKLQLQTAENPTVPFKIKSQNLMTS